MKCLFLLAALGGARTARGAHPPLPSVGIVPPDDPACR